MPFIGRDSELRDLDSVVENSASGRGGLVVISGEPGIGKSRLVREFISRHPNDFIVTVAASAKEQFPFCVWADVVAALDRKGITMERCESVQAVRAAAKNPGADNKPPVDPNDPIDETASRLLELINLSPQPPIIVIESIQNMDPDSARLFNYMSTALVSEPITIVATKNTSIPGPQADLPPQAINIELHGLSPTEVQSVLKSRFPDSSAEEIESIGRSMHRVSGGNPDAIVGLLAGSGDQPPHEDQLLSQLLQVADRYAMVGNTAAAYSMFARAAELAEQAGDADALAAATVGFAFPPDWRAGNSEALSLVRRTQTKLTEWVADSPIPDSPARVVVDALRAMLEIRLPQPSADGLQWSWVTRPDVAQPISADALSRARLLGDDYALQFALVAWRWTHRGPSFLASRTEVSTEALNLTITGDHPQILAEACVCATVDAFEAGNRVAAEKAIQMARWLGDETRDPRIQWRARILEAAIPGLDGDWETFHRLQAEAKAYGHEANLPGTLAMDAVLTAQDLIHTLDFSSWEWDNPLSTQIARTHPLSSATWTFGLAQIGQTELAAEWLRHTLTLLDDESSLTASATLLAFAALQLQDQKTARELIRLLGPWSGSIAVDANAGIIVGPVDLALARLCHLVGETDRALSLARSGNELKQQLTGETSNLERLIPPPEPGDGPELTERELIVLQLVGSGMTNKEIAAELSFSLATVRRDTINLYKKLEVRGRAGAVQKASDLGLLK